MGRRTSPGPANFPAGDPLRFLQISDVHLGASLSTSALGLPRKKREQRQREIQGALRTACGLAKDEGVDVVLLPGDLFDDESITGDMLSEAAETLGSCEIPVILAPGNHDFYAESSFYNPDFARSTYALSWPSNVHLIPGGGWTSFQLPEVPDVSFAGIGYTSHYDGGDRPLRMAPAPKAGMRNVLVFHGSRVDHEPPGKLKVLPFGDDDLANSGYDYAAIGHYHSYSTIQRSNGNVLGAYSGCPAGRGLDECGEKGVLLGELSSSGTVRIDFRPVDTRQIRDLSVDCTGIGNNRALLDRIDQERRFQSCRDSDILYVRLVGRSPQTLDPTIPAGFLDDRCFHVQVDPSGLRPDYDLEKYASGPDAETAEGRFVAEMQRRIAAAADSAQQSLLRRALYYGLDALIAGSVTPRYETAGEV